MPGSKASPATGLDSGAYGAQEGARKKKTALFVGLALLALLIVGGAIGIVVARLSDDGDENDRPVGEQVLTTPPAGPTSRGSGSAVDLPPGEATAEEVIPPAPQPPATPDSVGPDASSTAPDTSTSGAPMGGSTPSGTGGAAEPAAPTIPATPAAPTPPATPTPAVQETAEVATPAGTADTEGSEATVTPAPAMDTEGTETTATPAPATPAPATPAPVVPPAATPVAPAVPPPPVPAPVVAEAPALGPSNTWLDLPQVPIEMGEVAAGVLTAGGKAYLVVVGEHPNGSPDNGVTMIYDIAGETFVRAAPRPAIGDHHAAEVYNNKLYLLGGLKDGDGQVQIGELTGAGADVGIAWTAGAAIPFASGSAATALIGGKILYCGGITGDQTVDTCAQYDPAADAWNAGAVPAMPEGRNHAAACTDGSNFYVFGGRSGKNVVGPGFDETQIYSGGAWSMGTPIPFGRGGMGKAVHHNGKCYVFGGETNDGSAGAAQGVDDDKTVYTVDIYDIASDSWSQGADMPKGLHGIFPVKHQGGVYITAGGTEAAYSQSKLHFLYVL